MIFTTTTLKKIYSSLLISLVLMMFLNVSAQNQQRFVKVEGQQLKDANNKNLLLHGINVVNKNHATQYRGGMEASDVDSLVKWGYNCIRLGIQWAALEPEPGKIDNNYLLYIDSVIERVTSRNIYVILDMHQDLFSKKYKGNGAPLWACLDEGKEHYAPGKVWSDAYNTSEALQKAFDNFWKNEKASDGIGLQDHLAQVWRTVAARYANHPSVLGYDLLNEPFIGSPIQKMGGYYYQAISSHPGAASLPPLKNEQELMMFWMSDSGRHEIIKLLRDSVLFTKLIDATEKEYATFEVNHLLPFYQRMIAAMDQVDKNHLYFLEPSVSSNNGVISHLKNIVPGRMVYAPHAYDLVLDTDIPGAFSASRLQFIFSRHAATQKRLNVPIMIGEWGAFYNNNTVNEQAAFIRKQLDNLKGGDFYWDYGRNLSKRSYFNEIRKKREQY